MCWQRHGRASAAHPARRSRAVEGVEVPIMFVFERSFWTVAAGLGTAVGFLALSLFLERSQFVPDAPTPTAELRTPLESEAAKARLPDAPPHDISLANR
jgi:hypothetical protein